MTSLPRNRLHPRRAFTILAILAVAAILPGCDYDNRWHEEYGSVSADNRTGVSLDIYLDATFRLSVTSGTVGTMPGILEGPHTLDAYDFEGRLRATRGFTLRSDFVWLLQ